MLRLFSFNDSRPFLTNLFSFPRKLQPFHVTSADVFRIFRCTALLVTLLQSLGVFFCHCRTERAINQETLTQSSLEVMLVWGRWKQNKKALIYENSKSPNMYYSDVGAGLWNLDKCIKQPQVPAKQQQGITTIKGTSKFSLSHWKPIFCSSPPSRALNHFHLKQNPAWNPWSSVTLLNPDPSGHLPCALFYSPKVWVSPLKQTHP